MSRERSQTTLINSGHVALGSKSVCQHDSVRYAGQSTHVCCGTASPAATANPRPFSSITRRLASWTSRRRCAWSNIDTLMALIAPVASTSVRRHPCSEAIARGNHMAKSTSSCASAMALMWSKMFLGATKLRKFPTRTSHELRLGHQQNNWKNPTDGYPKDENGWASRWVSAVLRPCAPSRRAILLRCGAKKNLGEEAA
jgi:hypothetical protein